MKKKNAKDRVQSFCNHNYNDEQTSIIFSKKRKMIYPDRREGFCPCCQQVFIIDLQNKEDKSVD